MPKFKTKPFTVEAIQYIAEVHTIEYVAAWAERSINPEVESAVRQIVFSDGSVSRKFEVCGHQGWSTVNDRDFLIIEPDGRGLYPCDQATFERKYERDESEVGIPA